MMRPGLGGPPSFAAPSGTFQAPPAPYMPPPPQEFVPAQNPGASLGLPPLPAAGLNDGPARLVGGMDPARARMLGLR